MTNSDNLWRTQPMYSFAEAAHLSNVSTSTVRNWLVGYTGRNREIRPLFSSHTDQGPRISFLQLIEIVVAAKFRKAERVSYQTVYAAYVHAKDMYTSKNHLPINRREFLASFFGSKEKVIQSEIAVNDRQWRLCILIPYWNKVVAQFFGYIK